MEIRKSRLFQEPEQLVLGGKSQVPWENLSIKDFNETWAYRPYYIYGQFDHTQEVLVERVKEGIFL